MNNVLAQLTPTLVWKHFETICSIPHPSKHEEQLKQHIVTFGKQLNLTVLTDECGNILIRKPATKGYENITPVVLQAHIDMVPQKNNSTQHDFVTDPIKPRIEGNMVKATDTTLGADNGIGVASMMAILEDDSIEHGPLETLFTIDEETGMTGAFGLQSDWLQSKILINLDSEDEGELCIGCAGGLNANIHLPYTFIPTPDEHQAFTITITGLKGGHSGVDINLQRGNANKLLFRFIRHAALHYAIKLVNIDGGSLRNAIPREASATILVPTEFVEYLIEAIADFQLLYREEYKFKDNPIQFRVERAGLPEQCMDSVAQAKLIDAITVCPNGVIRMDDSMPGLVETSTNLAIVKSHDTFIEIKCLLRSSVESRKHDLSTRMESLCSLIGAEVIFDGDYPGWQPNINSPILKVCTDAYASLFNKDVKIGAIHAGLECGIIGSAYPQLDMISFGPTIKYPHSPDEYVEIESVQKFWNYLVHVLQNTPQA